MNLKTLLIIAVAAAFALGGHIFLSSTALAQSPPGHAVIGERNSLRRNAAGELECRLRRD